MISLSNLNKQYPNDVVITLGKYLLIQIGVQNNSLIKDVKIDTTGILVETETSSFLLNILQNYPEKFKIGDTAIYNCDVLFSDGTYHPMGERILVTKDNISFFNVNHHNYEKVNNEKV